MPLSRRSSLTDAVDASCQPAEIRPVLFRRMAALPARTPASFAAPAGCGLVQVLQRHVRASARRQLSKTDCRSCAGRRHAVPATSWHGLGARSLLSFFRTRLPLAPSRSQSKSARRSGAENLPHDTNPLGCVTISVGCATIVPGAWPALLDSHASRRQALYAAKHAGRNQVCSADPECPAGEVSLKPADNRGQKKTGAEAPVSKTAVPRRTVKISAPCSGTARTCSRLLKSLSEVAKWTLSNPAVRADVRRRQRRLFRRVAAHLLVDDGGGKQR